MKFIFFSLRKMKSCQRSDNNAILRIIIHVYDLIMEFENILEMSYNFKFKVFS